MTRSPSCRPDVRSSSIAKPVGVPVMRLPWVPASWIFWNAETMTSRSGATLDASGERAIS